MIFTKNHSVGVLLGLLFISMTSQSLHHIVFVTDFHKESLIHCNFSVSADFLNITLCLLLIFHKESV